MTHSPDPLARAHQTAHDWLNGLSAHLATEDHHFVLKALRAWLHLVRDRLTVEAAVHLGAQLPEVFRGIYYEGWIPHLAPIRYDAPQFVEAFSHRTGVPPDDVPRVAGALTAGLRERFSDGQLEHVSAVMPAALRDELGMDVPGADGQQGAPGQPRLERIEQQVAVLTDAVTKLVRGLESLPTDEPAEGRTARAAQEAHRILLSAAVEA